MSHCVVQRPRVSKALLNCNFKFMFFICLTGGVGSAFRTLVGPTADCGDVTALFLSWAILTIERPSFRFAVLHKMVKPFNRRKLGPRFGH